MITNGFVYRAFGFVSVLGAAFSWFVLKNNDATLFFTSVAVGMLGFHTWKKSQDDRFFHYTDSVDRRLSDMESDINHRFETVHSRQSSNIEDCRRDIDTVYRYIDDATGDLGRASADEIRDINSRLNNLQERVEAME